VETGRAALRNASSVREHRAAPRPTRIYRPRRLAAALPPPIRTIGLSRTGLANGPSPRTDDPDATNTPGEPHRRGTVVDPPRRPGGLGKGRTCTVPHETGKEAAAAHPGPQRRALQRTNGLPFLTGENLRPDRDASDHSAEQAAHLAQHVLVELPGQLLPGPDSGPTKEPSLTNIRVQTRTLR
jgi:hypothetical protein